MDVAAGVIVQNGLILACQRRAGDRHGLKWEFPGGKLVPGESPADGLARELREELGIESEVGPVVWHACHRYGAGSEIRLTFFLVREFSGTPQNLAFANIQWLPPAGLADLDFLEADRPLVERLANGDLP